MIYHVEYLLNAYLPSIYLRSWGVYSDHLPIFRLGCLLSYCWVLRVFAYFGIHSFISYVFCKYFLPTCSLSFYSIGSIFNEAEVLILIILTSIIFSLIMPLYLKSHCHSQGHVDFLLYYLLGILYFCIYICGTFWFNCECYNPMNF